jgi:hypothetical protein
VSTVSFEDRIAESLACINSFDLGDCRSVNVAKRMLMELKSEFDEQSPEAIVAKDAIVSIVAGMSKENREIVKDCMLFASLAANKASPEGGVKWCDTYTNVLTSCGWTPQSSAFSDYRTSNSTFTMQQEGLKILASAIAAMALPGTTSVLMLKVAEDALNVLQSSEKPLRLFENSCKKYKGAKFAIGSAVESDDQELVMAMGAVDFSTSLDVTNVLFWEWSSSSVTIKRGESNMILNRRHFDGIAETLRKRLGDAANDSLLEYEI